MREADRSPVPLEFAGAGVRLAADAYGPAAAPVVLLAHGAGQTRHSWDRTARAIAGAGLRAITFDARGHGESDRAPDGDYRTDAFVADLRALIAQLHAPPVLVGASLGGMTGLLLAGEKPGLLRALVLVDITVRPEPDGVERIVGFMTAAPDGFASLDDAGRAVAAYLPDRPRPPDAAGLTKNLRQDPDGRLRWHWDPALITGPRALPGSRSQQRAIRAARATAIPLLLVRGRRSELVSEEGARELLELVPHARYVDIAGAGHMVAGDRNDVFGAAVIEFLAEIGASSTLEEGDDVAH
jgi:non-heme chloroperoxidase